MFEMEPLPCAVDEEVLVIVRRFYPNDPSVGDRLLYGRGDDVEPHRTKLGRYLRSLAGHAQQWGKLGGRDYGSFALEQDHAEQTAPRTG